MIEISGALGTFLYLINHAYISLTKTVNYRLYFSVNFVAASLLVFSSTLLSSWQAVMVNLFWSIISLLLLMNINLSRAVFPATYFHRLMLVLTVSLVSYWVISGVFPIAWLAWMGTATFCLAYLLFVCQKIAARAYFSWNTFAALSLLPQLLIDENWSVFVLEACWAIISIVGVIRHYQQAHLID